MRKKVYGLAAFTLISASLAACNTDQGAMDTNDNNRTQPIGFYSNEHIGNNGDGVDNDGPVTEMMENANNGNGNREGANNGRLDNPTVPLADGDRGFERDNRFNRGDTNYHNQANEAGYYNEGDQQIADKVSNKVKKMKNVDDARTLVTRDNVYVAIDTKDRNNKDVKDKALKAAREIANGRNVQVVTDEGAFNRIRNIDNDIRNGNDRKTIDASIQDFMNDMGDAAREPVQELRNMTR
ncbi:YhcN/YlaJ family sporulation lipoprotein [Metabacillus arenae]|uniref:YhcN/YlaJ family sporulation lipoprotein n=1 Tax=Metabacillus arenae TaxID=2771434 RepID=A0A926NH68_9BACI|nr:YhcN/YlaJ family sporulation lipoprotein [Metabacillus arenae]MBD1381221.1 YhcN/YlaJ family sporulation lipoprotein [Metabacillus arenae]